MKKLNSKERINAKIDFLMHYIENQTEKKLSQNLKSFLKKSIYKCYKEGYFLGKYGSYTNE